jgi:spectinomycin phosphotransferase
MLNFQSISDQQIIDCLNANYDMRVTALTPILLGADLHAAVYKAQTNDKQSYFVKLKRGHSQDIGALIQLLLHDAGISQIIAPVKTMNDQSTYHLDNFTLVVYPFIEGHNGFSTNLTDDQWIVLGQALRNIHACELPASITNEIKQESYSPQWRNAVRSIYAHIDTDPHITDTIALSLLTWMKEHRKTIERLVDRAENLAQKIRKQSSEFVLCHSDIHSGNVLIANDGALYIVDWDQPIMAPKERDLMFIGGGIANVWNNPHEEKLFYEGYGKTEINKEIVAYYRHERIVEDIAEYSQQLILTTNGGNERAEMYQHFIDMFESRGVVDIAFETDSNFTSS